MLLTPWKSSKFFVAKSKTDAQKGWLVISQYRTEKDNTNTASDRIRTDDRRFTNSNIIMSPDVPK